MDYLDVEAARGRTDLRLVLTQGVPGPWGEAAKALFHLKGIRFTPVCQRGGGDNRALRAWTGHDNAPIVVTPGEAVRTTWHEILFFAERRAPALSLIPADPGERAWMFGLSHEIAGEDGLGWCRRLMMLHQTLSVPALADSPAGALVRRLGAKYGYSAAAAARAPARVAAILTLLAARLDGQRRRGSRFLAGGALSALDVYWATFAALLRPLPHAVCPMPDFLRTQYEVMDATVAAALHPALLEHRDFVYREFLPTPLDF